MERLAKQVLIVLAIGVLVGVLIGLLYLEVPKTVNAQRSDTVYSTLFSGVAVATISSAVENIGQSNHQVTVLFSNAPSQTCSSPAYEGEFQYSYDNVTYAAFGTPNTTNGPSNSAERAIWYATGAFPYVRFRLSTFDTTNCRATAVYSGVLGGSLNTQIQGTLQIGGQGAQSIKPVVIGGMSGSGTSNALFDIVNPAAYCNQVYVGSIAAGSATLMMGSTFGQTQICNITIQTSGAASTVAIAVYTENTCVTKLADLTPAFSLPLNVLPFSFSGGFSPAIPNSNSGFICATVTGGGATALIQATYAVITTR